MTPFNLRSLLLAAIFLSNCISWTASKHHFTHNVNGHRSRHRRQGEGLFLSASYVLPGGEGAGWGEWGAVSQCSRTCGGGVASQKRICLQIGPEGQPQCSGGDTKYFSCQTQDCPAGSKDFRAEQCSEYDDQLFRDIKYSWVPYTKAPNPCELNCMPHAERFYYRHKEKVTDGTRCNDESFDVCVDGTCQPVGCDMMLGSSAKEDKCRVCVGNNVNCHTTAGVLDTVDLRKGYNDMLLIPEGSTTIVIAEVLPSNNYLALRAKNGTFYLNGDYHIDFPRNLIIAGALWTYERSQQGFAAPDKLRSLGPTNEPLYLSLLLQDENVGIEYEYSLPTDMAPPQNKRYNWVHKEFSPCSATCGGGFQTRTVSCRSREELDEVEEGLCDEGLRPPTNQSCNTQACAPQWAAGDWGQCSKRCGKGGVRSREVHCQQIIVNGYPSIVADKECIDRLGSKPEEYQECNTNATCPTWFTGPWKPCDKLCDEGKQTRQVVCHQRNGRRVEILNDEDCEDERPPVEQPCELQPCDGVDWIVSPWNGCDSCLSKIRTRTMVCSTKTHVVVNDSFCAYHPTPSTQEACDPTALPPCQVQWYATQWSNCSVSCGEGVQSRKVFCGLFDGTSVLKVPDSRCADQPKYNDTKPCEIPKEQCPSQWFTAPWSDCDKKCGGGDQVRRVMCLRGTTRATDCDKNTMPSTSQSCNTGPCSADQLLPVSSAEPDIMDDYDDCEEEDVYAEVGLDIGASFTVDDMMFSDSAEGSGLFSTTYAEIESSFSDTEPTLSTDDLITAEGSGASSSSVDFTDDFTTEITAESGSGSSPTGTTDGTESTVSDASTATYSTDSTVSSDDTTSSDDAGSSTTPSGLSTETSESTTDNGSTVDTSESSTVTDSSTNATEATSEASESTDADVTTSAAYKKYSETVRPTLLLTAETEESEVTTEPITTEGSTEFTETTNEASTESSSFTETSESTRFSSTDTSLATETETTESSGSTTTDQTTEPTGTEETTVSGSTETSESEPTETSTTELSTESSESTVTTESGSTESTETTESGPTVTTETTESGLTETTETTESGATESTVTTESGPTETTETTESGPTETTETTESGPTETTETTESGPTETTETTESGATSETTEFSTVSETESSASTVSVFEDCARSEFGCCSDNITEAAGPNQEGCAPESTTESFGSSTTEEDESFTSLAVEWLTTKKPRMCRPRKCALSQFGCCPDKKTSAGGPFDEGCITPVKTCKQTKYGCCPDGVSPSPTKDHKGCPLPPCAETLFGCCSSDNKTAAEGNNQEGCPPPPPACQSSKFGCCKDGETEATGPGKQGCPETTEAETELPTSTNAQTDDCARSEFGCCYDNETEATGPNQEGCACTITEFGCCLDGVSPAQGPDFEGCLKNCNSSAYGCCPDGQTPAHGPNREGCCLRSAFGCCPDNYNYARGPHLEGCGCQYSPYGCCPDNVTIATGYDNKGCGCSYSQHGCCPDGHTEATGPKFEGCACHTYQFGCCPDGVTIARGPDGQGCHCLQSKYKCCGDGETHATGPNQEGCDCSSSKFGCCPDGRTSATGSKFQGCTDAPEDRQASCALNYERGPCRNFSVAWYFDPVYGGCSRFWYGGCEGNGNRFASKEDCDDTCVSPPPKEACKLPQSKGACLSYNVRWYYDTERETCLNFAYGGCLGNNNNFETRDLCQKQCEPEKTTDQCNLPIESGSCAGNFPRWGFNTESRRCEPFTWGGCEGNPNRFHTETACNLRCNPPGQPKLECSQPQDAGSCSETEAVWAFSQTENRCVPFYYTGCEGNGNRFLSRQECESSCPSLYVPDKCTLPYETGNCANYREKWYFDTKDQRCRQFYYGGCDGNENNFDSEQECERDCLPIPTTTLPPTTVAQTATQAPQQSRPQTLDRPDFCFLEYDTGPCTNFTTHYTYDYKTGRCVPFQYGGCGGNRNNFPDLQYCQYYCKAAQDVCQQPMLSGPCDDSQMRWFYDASTDSCSQFTYGGCQGNDNRFESRDECESRCKTGPAAEPTTITTTTLARAGEELPSGCIISPTLEACSASFAGEVWYLGPSRECVSHQNLAFGASCRTTGVYRSQEACERSCGAFRDINVCAYPVDAGRCTSYVSKYFYNSSSLRCEEFTYGGCMGGPNRFSTELECTEICKPTVDPCRQPADQGNCLARYEMWFYDQNSDQCQMFIYGGCGGNENRFETRGACEGRCRQAPDAVAVTTTTQAPVQQLEAKCVTPSLVPCGSNITAYYYDAESSSCRVAGIGGCEYENNYRSEEECERNCGAFRGLEVCQYQLDPGPCRAALPKFYYDSSSRECREFTYGGCQGGPNRFSTIEECEDNCRESGQAAECLEEVSTGRACGLLPSRRWYYDRARGGCRGLAFLGCGGTRNNFLSYQECAHRCNPFESEEQAELCDRYADECDALQSQCESIKVTVASAGCRRCECEHTCERQRQECEALSCSYGLIRITEDGCESCQCAEDPCKAAQCGPSERCVASAYRDPATKNVLYSAQCVTDTDSNEVVPECERESAACAALACRYGVQRASTPRGCVRCSCVPEDVDCGKLRDECDRLNCSYGLQRTRGDDGCERCVCAAHPCAALRCAAGERCAVQPYRDAAGDRRTLADCRQVNKPGQCPSTSAFSAESSCRTECNDDADCRGAGKCCPRGCSRLCLAPEEPRPTTQPPITQHITTYGPEEPAAPSAGAAPEPVTSAGEGGAATLRCIFHGNPPPRITWRFGELTIDSDYDRYRLLSDGSLEIVALVRNDSGVYVCVADNSLGRAQQEIQLLVTDPVSGPARIAGGARAVTGELGAPLTVRCRAYGHPPPAIYWYRGLDGPMVPYSNAQYEARNQTLTIRRLSTDTLGEYACYAYNGQDKPATWVVTVQAYQPDDNAIGRYLVPRGPTADATRAPRPPPVIVTPRPHIETTPYTVEVKVQVQPASTTISAGSELSLPCNVDGYPTPRVSWTKDDVTLVPTDTMWITDTRLTIPRTTINDSGRYGCHAANQYSTDSSYVQITVREVIIPSKCTDSPYFANCALIVQGKFCRHKYYSRFCCKSCVEAGQLDLSEAEMQADEPYRKK